jgi:hypothetical protein
VISVERKSNYFSLWDWTDPTHLHRASLGAGFYVEA